MLGHSLKCFKPIFWTRFHLNKKQRSTLLYLLKKTGGGPHLWVALYWGTHLPTLKGDQRPPEFNLIFNSMSRHNGVTFPVLIETNFEIYWRFKSNFQFKINVSTQWGYFFSSNWKYSVLIENNFLIWKYNFQFNVDVSTQLGHFFSSDWN